jgi:hypothetical protein
VYRFIQDHDAEARAPYNGADWLESCDASPRKLCEYFKRVALRLRHTEAFGYAASLENTSPNSPTRRSTPGSPSRSPRSL